MKDIRAAFDRSGRSYGLSFTAPTSFWYMRWFDLPGLAEASDWINVMSYGIYPPSAQFLTFVDQFRLAWRVGQE
jgi:GH18 family chitinase